MIIIIVMIIIMMMIITRGAGVRGGNGGPLSSSSPASLVSDVSSLPGVSTSSMSHTFNNQYLKVWNINLDTTIIFTILLLLCVFIHPSLPRWPGNLEWLGRWAREASPCRGRAQPGRRGGTGRARRLSEEPAELSDANSDVGNCSSSSPPALAAGPRHPARCSCR